MMKGYGAYRPSSIKLIFIGLLRGGNKRLYEEYAYVIDVVSDNTAEPKAQLIGERFLHLLEASITPNVQIKLLDRVFIGKGKTHAIARIIRRISYDELTEKAKRNLQQAIHKIILGNEAVFVDIINKAHGRAIARWHPLQSLPGLNTWERETLIDEVGLRPFESFKDIERRTGIKISRLASSLALRIHEELKMIERGRRKGNTQSQRGYLTALVERLRKIARKNKRKLRLRGSA